MTKPWGEHGFVTNIVRKYDKTEFELWFCHKYFLPVKT